MGGRLWGSIALRLVQSVFVVLVVVTVVFVVARATGDPITIMAPIDATQAEIDQIKEEEGLNDPLYVQYGSFLLNSARLDMGTSFRTRQSALEEVTARLWPTLQLGIAALAFSLVVGIPVGVLSAVKRGTPPDFLARTLALLGQATPNFWLGLMLILLFAVRLGWFPTGGSGSIRNLILPAVTLGAASCAAVVRLTRSGMIDVLSSDFIRTARAKGLSGFAVLRRHALRHALVPVLTILGIQVGHVIAGAIVVETVFAWPGMGRLMIQSINSSDYPVVQVGVIFIATSIVLANALVDICYTIIDPRIRAQ
ncbi:MAG: ABC transporter permease [Dehalococcoidia bacterium]